MAQLRGSNFVPTGEGGGRPEAGRGQRPQRSVPR
jgi:hypothetical protein